MASTTFSGMPHLSPLLFPQHKSKISYPLKTYLSFSSPRNKICSPSFLLSGWGSPFALEFHRHKVFSSLIESKTPNREIKMFGFRKGAAEKPPAPKTTSDDFFDSDDESSDKKKGMGRRTSSEPALGDGKKKDFDSMSVQELESYAVNQAEETTSTVNNCLKIAEDIRGDASKTLETLHAQGEQIHRTHVMAADMEKDLSKGEKLLNSLGGMFSMPWKAKKGKTITGPKTSKDDHQTAKASTKEQKEKLVDGKGRGSKTPSNEPTTALQKVDMEKNKQDDALNDLSDILGDLKGMATEMGTELDRQNKALDDLDEDIDELNSRVKGANDRARKLLK